MNNFKKIKKDWLNELYILNAIVFRDIEFWNEFI